VVKHPKAAPFRNAGWVHLEAFKTLMPQSTPRGNHVFRSHRAPPQATFPFHEDDDYDGHSQQWDLEKSDEEDGDKGEDDLGSSEKENDENEVPPRTPGPATRKRSAAAPATGTAKKPRTSGGVAALQDIADQALDFNTIFRGAFGTSASNTDMPPTPIRLQKAIKRAQKLEKWMDKKQLVSLLEVLEGSKNAVDVYDSLDDEELRVLWVKRKVGITI